MLRRALLQTSPTTSFFATRVWDAARRGAWAAGGRGGGGGGGRGRGGSSGSGGGADGGGRGIAASQAMALISHNPSLLWASLESAKHDALRNHERPDRVFAAIDGLLSALDSDKRLASLCRRVEIKKDEDADDDDSNNDARAAAEAVHSREYLSRLASLCRKAAAASESPDRHLKVADEDDETEFTYVTESSLADALGAVGVALRLWGELRSSSSSSSSSSTSPRAALTLVRPPGHHAGRGIESDAPDSPSSAPSGFCLINTVAAVARRITSSSPSSSSSSPSSCSNDEERDEKKKRRRRRKRVLVIDFDVHVGDGTQDIFWGRRSRRERGGGGGERGGSKDDEDDDEDDDDNRDDSDDGDDDDDDDDEQVCVVDIHECGAWPGGGGIEVKGERTTRRSGSSEDGSKNSTLFGGVSRIVNVPLPPSSGDAAARAAVERVVAPLFERFRPHAVVASAGFDAHALEPLAGLRWEDSTYEYFGARIVALAQRHASGGDDGDGNDRDDDASDNFDFNDGKVIFVLEGGYSRQALRTAVAALARGAATMEVPPPPTSSSEGLDEASEAMIRAVIEEHGLV